MGRPFSLLGARHSSGASFMSGTRVPRSQPMTKPQLRECFGCGKFQIVPALGPDMRSDCVRCGTSLRRTRAEPMSHTLALTAAALALFGVRWLAMLMKVSGSGIEHDTNLHSGPSERVNRGLWPAASAVA